MVQGMAQGMAQGIALGDAQFVHSMAFVASRYWRKIVRQSARTVGDQPASMTRFVRTEAGGRKHIVMETQEQTMAGGWSRDGAVQDQIDASVDDAVKRARSQLPRGESLRHCEECDAEIPEARRAAIPGVRRCVECQTVLDEQRESHGGYNRRGSKDSQLR